MLGHITTNTVIQQNREIPMPFQVMKIDEADNLSTQMREIKLQVLKESIRFDLKLKLISGMAKKVEA